MKRGIINKGKNIKRKGKESISYAGKMSGGVGVELAGMPEPKGTNAVVRSNRRQAENAQSRLDIDEFGKHNCSKVRYQDGL